MLRPIALAVLIGLPMTASGEAPPSAEPADGAAPGAAAVAHSAADPLSPAAGADDDGVLDKTRYYVHYGVEWVARGVDGWFGDKPFEEGGRVAGAIVLSFLWRQDEGLDYLTRFRVRVDLPNLRDKAYLFVGRDNERELPA